MKPQIQENVSLKSMNTFGIDAKARFFTVIQQYSDLQALDEGQVPKLVLGEGSNILFTQDYPGLVLKNAIKGVSVLKEDDDHVWLKAGAGENWHDLVVHCVEKGYGGVENLSLIPGTVGAAPIQNIGAYGVELKDSFVELEAFNLGKGIIETFDKEACSFGYRDSIFKTKLRNQFAILSVTLKLNKNPTYHLDYGNIKETLEKMQVKNPDLKSISNAVIQIRRSKLPDPKELGNAGSFFKNPMIAQHHFATLQKTHPDVPHFAVSNSTDIKIPAAWLIEKCGFKGKRFGETGVYDKQALILVNYGAGSGQDIKLLSEKIQQAVQNEFGIELTPEVNFI